MEDEFSMDVCEHCAGEGQVEYLTGEVIEHDHGWEQEVAFEPCKFCGDTETPGWVPRYPYG